MGEIVDFCLVGFAGFYRMVNLAFKDVIDPLKYFLTLSESEVESVRQTMKSCMRWARLLTFVSWGLLDFIES